MQAIEFQASVIDGTVRIPDEYRDIAENKKVRFVMMYHENDTEQSARQKIIAHQVEDYYEGKSNLLSQDEAHAQMKLFMQTLRHTHADH